jgi:ABC-type uncharacterized transport system substrate-binding protein
LKELVSGLSRVGLLINPDQQSTAIYVEVMTAAANELGLTLRTFEARTLDKMEPALDAMVEARMQAFTPSQGGTAFQARHIIPKLALARGLAMCSYSRETFDDGALISYGPDQLEMCRRSAVYADKILKGAKPGELPVEQPTEFEFLINCENAWHRRSPAFAANRRRGHRIGAPAASWCDPAGESPAQVRSSVCLVVSVAWPLATVDAKRTQQLHGVWD